jgi:hypothetical protein
MGRATISVRYVVVTPRERAVAALSPCNLTALGDALAVAFMDRER